MPLGPHDTRRVRGKGVVPWKHGFSTNLETYMSQSKSKVETKQKIQMIEGELALNDHRIHKEVKCQVAEVLSQRQPHATTACAQ